MKNNTTSIFNLDEISLEDILNVSNDTVLCKVPIQEPQMGDVYDIMSLCDETSAKRRVEHIAALTGGNVVIENGDVERKVYSVEYPFADTPLSFEEYISEFGILPRSPEDFENYQAVPISESVTDEYIICLLDGAKVRLLDRYLNNQYRMSFAEYRKHWGLPDDYPRRIEMKGDIHHV
jgi:ROS/MUCR transcriptional regulator protein